MRPPKGAKRLRIELLDSGGRWVEIWSTRIKVTSGPAAGAQLRPEIVPDQLRKLLQARRADPAADLRPLARQLALESATVTLDTLPNPPFFGALENPLVTGGSQFGKLKVEGWIIHQEQRIRRLIGTTHPLAENEMDYGDRVRAEAGELFPNHPYAGRSQFFGMVDIDETAGDPSYLEIFAELEDGTRHLVFVRRFFQRGCNQMERPLPEFSRGEFFRVVRLFLAGCRAQKISLGPLDRLWHACASAYENFRRFAPASLAHLTSARAEPYAAWQQANRLTPRLRAILTASAQSLAPNGPRFVLLLDTRGCTPAQLRACADSLLAQIYPSWEAWFVGDVAAPAGDPRFKAESAKAASDTVRALNAAVHQATGNQVALLPGHSRLSPDALLEVAETLAAGPQLELVYTDEDRMDDAGHRTEPNFKPAWSPAFAESGLFPGQLSVVSRERFIALGSLRDEYSLVPWFDLLLRLGDRLTPAQVAHIPLVLHHIHASVPRETDPSHASVEQSRTALVDAQVAPGPHRLALPAGDGAFAPAAASTNGARDPTILTRLQVTIVIPTRDRLHLLQECIELLDETVDWRYVKLIIVDDHSRDADAVRYLETIQQRKDLMCKVAASGGPQRAVQLLASCQPRPAPSRHPAGPPPQQRRQRPRARLARGNGRLVHATRRRRRGREARLSRQNPQPHWHHHRPARRPGGHAVCQGSPVGGARRMAGGRPRSLGRHGRVPHDAHRPLPGARGLRRGGLRRGLQ